MSKPTYDDQHVAISETKALETFHPERLKASAPAKISKTQDTRTRWQVRPEGSLLAVLSISKGVLDLCWWNERSKAWTYINTIKTVRNA